MRLDAKGVVRMLNKNTGDGVELTLGTTCCDKFGQEFPTLLGELFDGKVVFIDVDTDGDGTKDTFSGVKAVFLDTAGNTIVETPLDGTNGKVDMIDTGRSKILRFKGSVIGDSTATSEVYVANVIITAVGISTSDMKTPIEFNLGSSSAPANSSLAEVDTSGKKGIKVVPANTKFEFDINIELK